MLRFGGPGSEKRVGLVLTLVVVHRRVAEGSPHPLEAAGPGVEHGDTVVAVAVGHEQLVGRRMDLLIRRPVEVHRVGVALVPVAAADLHDERAVLRELQQLVVVDRLDPGHAVGRTVVAAQPDEALVIDVETVFTLGPLVAGSRAAPGLDEVACRVEDDNRRRRHRGLLGGERQRTVQDPYVVLRIDGYAGRSSELHLGRHRGPRPVDLKDRQAATLRRRRPAGRRRTGQPCRHQAGTCGRDRCD